MLYYGRAQKTGIFMRKLSTFQEAEKMGDCFPNYSYMKHELHSLAEDLDTLGDNIAQLADALGELEGINNSSANLLGSMTSMIHQFIIIYRQQTRTLRDYIPSMSGEMWDKFDHKFYDWLDSLDMEEFTGRKAAALKSPIASQSISEA